MADKRKCMSVNRSSWNADRYDVLQIVLDVLETFYCYGIDSFSPPLRSTPFNHLNTAHVMMGLECVALV